MSVLYLKIGVYHLYNYLRESKTDKLLTIYTLRKGFTSDIFEWFF